MEKFYGPEEDTHFMIEALGKYLKKNIPKRSLEIGIGNGQVSKIISEVSTKHIGVDINPYAIEETNTVCSKGEYLKSDLFSKVDGIFDLIAFNPPYLPAKKGEEDDWIKKAIVGGKKGYELIVRFLDELPKYLSRNGRCFLLFSSLSRPEVILDKCAGKFLDVELVLTKTIMQEDIVIYEIKKSAQLNDLEGKGYSYITFFARGTHGKIYTAIKNGRKYAIKSLNLHNQAIDAIKNEAEKMQIANTVNVGPKFIDFNSNLSYMIYEFIEGEPWQKYFPKIDIIDAKGILLNMLNQCNRMDEIGFEKKEMKRPNKNVLIENGKPILIDFERGIRSEYPGNVTQFLQYFVGSKFAIYLRDNGIEFNRADIIKIGLAYKTKEITFLEVEKYVRNVLEKPN